MPSLDDLASQTSFYDLCCLFVIQGSLLMLNSCCHENSMLGNSIWSLSHFERKFVKRLAVCAVRMWTPIEAVFFREKNQVWFEVMLMLHRMLVKGPAHCTNRRNALPVWLFVPEPFGIKQITASSQINFCWFDEWVWMCFYFNINARDLQHLHRWQFQDSDFHVRYEKLVAHGSGGCFLGSM